MNFTAVSQRFFASEFVSPTECTASDYPLVPTLAGTRFGAILRSFAPTSRLVDVYNLLLGPDRLGIEDGMIVFCEENQNTSYWGVRVQDCALDDPPVYRCVNEDPIEWTLDFESLDGFFSVFCLWQAMNGAWPFHGFGRAGAFKATTRALGPWEAIDIPSNTSGISFFCHGNDLIAGTAGNEFFVAARTDAAWRSIASAAPSVKPLHHL